VEKLVGKREEARPVGPDAVVGVVVGVVGSRSTSSSRRSSSGGGGGGRRKRCCACAGVEVSLSGFCVRVGGRRVLKQQQSHGGDGPTLWKVDRKWEAGS